jgi:hypothetical protein
MSLPQAVAGSQLVLVGGRGALPAAARHGADAEAGPSEQGPLEEGSGVRPGFALSLT